MNDAVNLAVFRQITGRDEVQAGLLPRSPLTRTTNMGMHGKRFTYLVPDRGTKGVYHIVDSHLLPKGWFHSTKEERAAAVVYVEPYRGFSAGMDDYYHMKNVLAGLNDGTRQVPIDEAAA